MLFDSVVAPYITPQQWLFNLPKYIWMSGKVWKKWFYILCTGVWKFLDNVLYITQVEGGLHLASLYIYSFTTLIMHLFKNSYCGSAQWIPIEQVREMNKTDFILPSCSLRFTILTLIFISTAAATAKPRHARIIPTVIFLSDLKRKQRGSHT